MGEVHDPRKVLGAICNLTAADETRDCQAQQGYGQGYYLAGGKGGTGGNIEKYLRR